MNKVTLIGNLGQDPELRYTPNGTAVCTFSMATTEHFKDKGGDTQDKTEWHSIVAWGARGETANKYLKKGSKVAIEGRIQTRSWEDQDNNKRYKTEIVVTHIEFLSRSEGKPLADKKSQDEAAEAMAEQTNGVVIEDLPF